MLLFAIVERLPEDLGMPGFTELSAFHRYFDLFDVDDAHTISSRIGSGGRIIDETYELAASCWQHARQCRCPGFPWNRHSW